MAKRKKQIEILLPEFIVINDKAEYYAGMKGGYFYWSDDFNEARSFREIQKFECIKRFEPHQHPELIYINDL